MARTQPGFFNYIAQLSQTGLRTPEILALVEKSAPRDSVTYGMAANALEYFRSPEGVALLDRLKASRGTLLNAEQVKRFLSGRGWAPDDDRWSFFSQNRLFQVYDDFLLYWADWKLPAQSSKFDLPISEADLLTLMGEI